MRSFRPCQNPSDLLVQIDGEILIPVVDLIRRIYRRLQFKSQFPCDSGWSQVPRRQQELKTNKKIFGTAGAAARGGLSGAWSATPCALAAHGGRPWPAASRKSLLGGAQSVRHAWCTVAAGDASHVARRCRAWRGSVRPCAARYVGGGRRRPANLRQRCDCCFSSRLSSGLSRAAHEVFGPIFDIGLILIDFEIFEILGLKLF
ncbi:hypothetical protein F511_17907 [Dorcoceras hygrometricum]|uniref:Uncharacterized protein n=1 Tax=Dorcoceras hygrometricum TaxID=472368 RepID=A0A2Z7AKE9_9LAMI|nr:hypothetical protein F511_17907 [Dorcoceras hygrometricum]